MTHHYFKGPGDPSDRLLVVDLYVNEKCTGNYDWYNYGDDVLWRKVEFVESDKTYLDR